MLPNEVNECHNMVLGLEIVVKDDVNESYHIGLEIVVKDDVKDEDHVDYT